MSATILSPAALLHAPMDTIQTTSESVHHGPINMFRVSCSCGYRGCWYSLESFALDAHKRHAERNLEGGR